MKKLIAIIGILAIVLTIFTSTETNNINMDLTSLYMLNTANAENGLCGPLCGDASGTRYCCKGSSTEDCAAGVSCPSCSG